MKTQSLLTLVKVSLLLLFLIGAFSAQAAGHSDLAVTFGCLAYSATFLPAGSPTAMLSATVLTITDILTEFGAYYSGEDNKKALLKKFFQKSETEADFNSRITEATRLELANATISRVLQRFQKAFTPIGDPTFTPQIIDLYKMKVDLSFYPDEVEESWLGFLASNGLDRKEWPLIRYLLEELALAQLQEDLEKNEFFFGVPGVIVPGTATAAGTSMLGIREQLKGAAIQQVAVGAVPADAVLFVKYIEDMFYSIPELHRNELDKIFMSKNLELRFKTGMREKYNINYSQVDDLTTIIDTKVKIAGRASHGTSTTIWTTPAVNRICGTKKPGNDKIFKIEEAKREVLAMTDFYKGVGFWNDGFVYRNNVAIV
ncbi:MAG TPA: hypothetical protein VGB63_13135 [Pedobacter sp.]|jgi:hypothetical protein